MKRKAAALETSNEKEEDGQDRNPRGGKAARKQSAKQEQTATGYV